MEKEINVCQISFQKAVSLRVEQHIVPTFRLSPLQALSPLSESLHKKVVPISLGFMLVPVYWKNGDKFFKSDSDIRKSNVRKD